MRHDESVDRSGGRHRQARHRAPSAFERGRGRALDTLADVVDVLPRGRALSACAIGGVLVATGVTAGAQAVVPTSTETATHPMTVLATPIKASDTVIVEQDAQLRTAEVQVKADGLRQATEQREKEAAEARRKAAEEKAERERQEALESADPREVARAMLGDFGWDQGQFSCLDRIWSQESGWRVDAENPSSGAYGIPQSLPGTKMASAGDDWRTNPATQIEWGLGYIEGRYGSPCAAWDFKKGAGWY